MKKVITGKQFRDLRVQAKLTQEELGKRIGRSRDFVSNVENEVSPTFEKMTVADLQKWWEVCNAYSTSKKAMLKDALKSLFA